MNSNPTLLWFIFHAIQIILFNFYISKKMSHLSFIFLKRRNPHLVESLLNKQYLHTPMIDYVIGFIALGFLSWGYFSFSSQLYWSGKYTSLFGFLFVSSTIDLIQYERLKRKIPLVAKRSADFKARGVGKSVPIWCWILFLFLSIVGLFFVGNTKVFLIQLGVIIFILASGYSIEKRAKLPIEQNEDKEYRESEVWTVYIIGVTLAIAPILSRFFGHYGIDAIYSSLAIVSFLLFINSKVYKKIIDKDEPLSL